MNRQPYQAKLERRTLAAAFLAVFAVAIAMAAPPFVSLDPFQTSMLTFHLVMELFAIIIAVLIVVVTWHTFDAKGASSVNVLICGFMIVAVCDLVHALTYDGMPNVLGPSNTSRAIFFWFMGRSFEVLTLALIAVQWIPPFSRWFWAAAGLGSSALLVWFGSYQLDLFPRTFISGLGVTPFKADYEYALCASNILVAFLFWRRAQISALARDYLMALSCFVMGVGEIMFTAYVAPSDFQNIYGHGFKLVAYGLLYWATFVTSMRQPFEDVRSSENRLRESEERIRSISDNLPNSVLYQLVQEPDGTMKFLHVSESSRQVYGLSPQEIIHDPNRLYALIEPEDMAMLVATRQQAGSRQEAIEMDFRLKHKDGTLRWIRASSAPRKMADGRVVWDGVNTDVTDRKSAQDQIARLGFYDVLTGLPNRRLLMDQLGQALTASNRSGRFGALFFLDLDNFKDLNDTLGHHKGDELLKQVALRLAGHVDSQDTVSRFGGDEFAVLLVGLSENMNEAATQARAVAEKFLSSLRLPFDLQGERRHTTLSIGISLFGDRPTSVDQMMKNADLAMYRAKSAGRNGLCFYDPEMQIAATERATMEADLHKGIESRQFVLHFQPVLDADQVTGVEALVRWAHPEKGMISPAKFIGVAEQSGLIVPLGHWVLESACLQLVKWAQDPSTQALTMAVNVSVRQFRQADFARQVLETLESTGANPRRLKLELTESLLVDDVESIIGKMMTLQFQGVSFSLDDFGTGYSSLSNLKRLPLSALKIDQSFVRDILVDPNDAAIARTVIALAQSLRLAVIAEGVESEGQRDFLEQHGCTGYQGYLFCRPLPLEELEVYLTRRSGLTGHHRLHSIP
jgi:diguanylate cyclase (GGDEF)-like protein/PAS domain S-box-containing protein